jgi:hypothetical protein
MGLTFSEIGLDEEEGDEDDSDGSVSDDEKIVSDLFKKPVSNSNNPTTGQSSSDMDVVDDEPLEIDSDKFMAALIKMIGKMSQYL